MDFHRGRNGEDDDDGGGEEGEEEERCDCRICLDDLECDDGDPCTTDVCTQFGCFSNLGNNTCSNDHQCKNTEKCGGCQCFQSCFTEGVFVNCPAALECNHQTCIDGDCKTIGRDIGCCLDASDCDDLNQCTRDVCSPPFGPDFRHARVCSNPKNPLTECASDFECGSNEICLNCSCVEIIPDNGECLISEDCNDNATCTIDICNKKCACEHIVQANCCEQDSDCGNPFDTCRNPCCNITTGRCFFVVADLDMDGVPCTLDCNDTDNGIGVPPTWFRDEDGDGDGVRSLQRVSCTRPMGFAPTGTDCDDTNPLISSGSMECCATLFSQQFKLLRDGGDVPPAGALMGSSVSLHEETLLMGAPNQNFNSTFSGGVAYVMVKDVDFSWSVQQKLFGQGILLTLSFGTSVSIMNDVAAIGAPLSFIEDLNDGAVFVFERTGSTWIQLDILVDNSTGRGFGEDVDVFEDWIVVINDRSVWIFRRSGNQWPVFQIILLSGQPSSVAFDKRDGLEFVVGRKSNDEADVFQFNGTQWNLVQTITGDDTVNFDLFGESVDMENDVIVVGAPNADYDIVGLQSNAGAGYVFVKNDSLWIQLQKLIPPDAAVIDICGTSVAITNDTILLGCPGDDTLLGNNIGSIQMYKLSGNFYTDIGKMIPFDVNGLTIRMGQSVDVWENTILGGAPFEDTSINTGAIANIGAGYISTCIPVFNCIAPFPNP